MSDDEIDRHMSWCPAPHVGRNNYDKWDCVLTHTISEDLAVTMTGVHCDTLSITVDGTLVDVDDLDQVCTVLYGLRDVFAASRAEADCDLHPQLHAEDEEDEDEEELVCDVCRLGAGDDEGLWSTAGLGYDGPNRYLCDACCAASGIDTTRRR